MTNKVNINKLKLELKRQEDILEKTTKLEFLKSEYKNIFDEIDSLNEELVDLNTIGWRVCFSGDEYNYGGYTNYLYQDYPTAKKIVEEIKLKKYCYIERIKYGEEIRKNRVN